MLSLSEIVKAIRDDKKLKYDQEVADLIGIPIKSFRTAKSRNLVPYEKLVNFCEKENKSADWVFFGRGESDEPGFGSANPQEKAFLDKVLKVYRNPATKEGLESTVDTMAKVPVSESEK